MADAAGYAGGLDGTESQQGLCGLYLIIGGVHVDCDFGFGSMELRNFYLCTKKMRLRQFILSTDAICKEEIPIP